MLFKEIWAWLCAVVKQRSCPVTRMKCLYTSFPGEFEDWVSTAFKRGIAVGAM